MVLEKVLQKLLRSCKLDGDALTLAVADLHTAKILGVDKHGGKNRLQVLRREPPCNFETI